VAEAPIEFDGLEVSSFGAVGFQADGWFAFSYTPAMPLIRKAARESENRKGEGR